MTLELLEYKLANTREQIAKLKQAEDVDKSALKTLEQREYLLELEIDSFCNFTRNMYRNG